MAYTTTTLLESIAKRAAIPTSQSTFTNANILEMASEAIELEVLPKMLQARQEFYVFSETLTPTKNSDDLFYWIRIPYRAVGQTIIGIYDPADDSLIDPTYYWVEGNKIYFEEGVKSSYKFKYYLRPSKLIELVYAAQIATITRGAIDTTITVLVAPVAITTGAVCDFVRGTAGYDTLAIDKTLTTAATTTYTFPTTSIPSELAVGDYVTLSDQSPVPQVPQEWFTYLAQWTAVELLESLGDIEAAAVATKRLQKMETNALSLISPRIEKKGKAIMTQLRNHWRW